MNDIEIIENFCEEYDFELTVFTDYQRRITGKNKRLDIYHVNKRYHDINNNFRGDYSCLPVFLDVFFKTSSL